MEELRIPQELKAHAIWSSDDQDRGSRVVYVTERRRRQIAALAAVAAIAAGLAIVLAAGGHVFPYLIAPLALLVFAGVYQHGGRSGFYELTSDGGLGTYLGRRAPDLSHLRRRRLRGSMGV
jgi:fatty acid desaturase